MSTKSPISSDILIRRYSATNRSRYITNTFFLMPAFALYLFVVVIPFFQGIPYSFTDWNGVSATKNFVGFKNYIRLFGATDFKLAITNTLLYTAMYVVGANLVGLAIALLISKNLRLNNLARTLIFMPYVISMLTAGFVWKYIYSNVYTPIFQVQSPLTISSQALVGIVIISIWRTSGYCMLIYIAALQGVPNEYYEAAVVEGAGWFTQFRRITIPMIMPAFYTSVAMLIAWGMKVFDTVMATTGGGPGKSTITMSMYVYNNIFGFMKAGYGQASAVVMTIVSLAITIAVSRLFGTKETYI